MSDNIGIPTPVSTSGTLSSVPRPLAGPLSRKVGIDEREAIEPRAVFVAADDAKLGGDRENQFDPDQIVAADGNLRS
jgi:hypothetical protein